MYGRVQNRDYFLSENTSGNSLFQENAMHFRTLAKILCALICIHSTVAITNPQWRYCVLDSLSPNSYHIKSLIWCYSQNLYPFNHLIISGLFILLILTVGKLWGGCLCNLFVSPVICVYTHTHTHTHTLKAHF